MPIVNTTSQRNAGLDFTTKPAVVDGSSTGLDKNAFLKLLAAQARYQDPLSPSDNTQQMAQLAQFSSLEQMSNVVTELKTLGQASSTDRALSLVGRDVTYLDAAGTATTGVVESVTITPEGPRLKINGLPDITPSAVTEVR